MRRTIGIQMFLPAGKLPGFYAQIIKRIADRAELVDRDKELLFAKPEDVEAIVAVLEHYAVMRETGEWLLLDEAGWQRGRIWDDYALETRSGSVFLDLKLAAVIALTGNGADSEPEQAAHQLAEHAIASLPENDRWLWAVDRQLLQLAEGIASAYSCRLAVLH